MNIADIIVNVPNYCTKYDHIKIFYVFSTISRTKYISLSDVYSFLIVYWALWRQQIYIKFSRLLKF